LPAEFFGTVVPGTASPPLGGECTIIEELAFGRPLPAECVGVGYAVMTEIFNTDV
jgi:hypothetical protein